jgi:hypothetical protein
MGWSGGSGMMDGIVRGLRKAKLPDDVRLKVYKVLVPAFEGEDCDTLYECWGADPMLDKALGPGYAPEQEG